MFALVVSLNILMQSSMIYVPSKYLNRDLWGTIIYRNSNCYDIIDQVNYLEGTLIFLESQPIF